MSFDGNVLDCFVLDDGYLLRLVKIGSNQGIGLGKHAPTVISRSIPQSNSRYLLFTVVIKRMQCPFIIEIIDDISCDLGKQQFSLLKHSHHAGLVIYFVDGVVVDDKFAVSCQDVALWKSEVFLVLLASVQAEDFVAIL